MRVFMGRELSGGSNQCKGFLPPREPKRSEMDAAEQIQHTLTDMGDNRHHSGSDTRHDYAVLDRGSPTRVLEEPG